MPHCLRLIAATFIFAVSAVVQANAASLDGLAVEVKNESEPVLCAEKDNVAVSFANKNVRSFPHRGGASRLSVCRHAR